MPSILPRSGESAHPASSRPKARGGGRGFSSGDPGSLMRSSLKDNGLRLILTSALVI
jgi:hypothetical protein